MKRKPTRGSSETNELTQLIITRLLSIGIFAYRQNVLPIPVLAAGQLVGYRPPPVTGIPDIQAVVSLGKSSYWPAGGGSLGLEIKTGADRIRPSQEGFHANVRACQGIILMVHTYADFLSQIIPLLDLLTPQQLTLLYAPI